MQKKHINDRGSHTSVIEGAIPVITFFNKQMVLGAMLSPGKIETGVGSKSKSIKLKHINNELYEMVIVYNGTRQEFKLFTRKTGEEIISAIKLDKKLRDWLVKYTDMRAVGKSVTTN